MTEKEIYHAAIDRLARQLRDCRGQFQLYGDNHIAKTPAQVAKAEVNYMMVGEINSTLTHVGDLLNGLDAEQGIAERNPV